MSRREGSMFSLLRKLTLMKIHKSGVTECYRKQLFRHSKLHMVCGPPYPKYWPYTNSTRSINSSSTLGDKTPRMTSDNNAAGKGGLHMISILESAHAAQINPRQGFNNNNIQAQHPQQNYDPSPVIYPEAEKDAVHFFVGNGAAVRFHENGRWIGGGTSNSGPVQCCWNSCYSMAFKNYSPYHHTVNTVDCTYFRDRGVTYEGIRQLSHLTNLKCLILRNQGRIDAWCLDRIAGQNGNTLEYLDISDCDLDVGCIVAVGRMTKLKTLTIKSPNDVEVWEALKELVRKKPELQIQVKSPRLVDMDEIL